MTIDNLIQKMQKWLERRGIDESIQDEASRLFWEDRPDLAPIEENISNDNLFGEWFLLDFSINGYDFVLADDRKTFIKEFLKENRKKFSKKEIKFIENVANSIMHFYKVVEVGKKFIKIRDLVDNKIERLNTKKGNKNSALIKNVKKGEIFYGRFCKDADDELVIIGGQIIPIKRKHFEVLFPLIKEVHKLYMEDKPDEMPDLTFDEFLKWNSYIYIREVTALRDGLTEMMG